MQESLNKTVSLTDPQQTFEIPFISDTPPKNMPLQQDSPHKVNNSEAKFVKTSSWPTFPKSAAALNCDQTEPESQERKKDKANK